VARLVLTTSAAAVILCGALATRSVAQQPTAADKTATTRAPTAEQKTPQQHLDEAKKLVDSINESSLSGGAARQLANLKRDLNELASAYLSAVPAASGGVGTTGTTVTPPRTGAGGQGAAGVPPATTGTSIPDSPSAAAKNSWRAKYVAVDRDLRSLVGSGSNVPSGTTTATSAPVSGGEPNLDAAVRGELQEVKAHLQLFYAMTVGQPEAVRPKK